MKLSEEQIFRIAVAIVALAICTLALTGCFTSSREEQTDQQKTRRERYTGQLIVPIPVPGTPPTETSPGYSPSVQPMPIAVDITRTVDETTTTVGHSDSKSGVDTAALAQQITSTVMAGVKTAFPSVAPLLNSISPAPKSGTDWVSMITAASTLIGGAGAAHVINRQRIRRAEQDAEEGWTKAEENARRAEQYALKLPPS